MPAGGPVVIQKGDLLWTDFGVVAENLHTDTQHMGYVMKDGESEVPAGLRQCLAKHQPAPGHPAQQHGAGPDRK